MQQMRENPVSQEALPVVDGALEGVAALRANHVPIVGCPPGRCPNPREQEGVRVVLAGVADVRG